MRGLIVSLPLLVPVLLGGIALGVFTARPLARRLGTHPFVAFLLVAGMGLIMAATLTPFIGSSSETPAAAWCDLTRVGLAPAGLLLRVSDPSLNVLLFVPLGIAIGLLPAGAVRRGLVVGALALPLAIELTQILLADLGRGCESADIIDNVSGLLIGLAIPAGARWLARSVRPMS